MEEEEEEGRGREERRREKSTSRRPISSLHRDPREREVGRPRNMPKGPGARRGVRDEIGYQLSRDDYNVSWVGLG